MICGQLVDFVQAIDAKFETHDAMGTYRLVSSMIFVLTMRSSCMAVDDRRFCTMGSG